MHVSPQLIKENYYKLKLDTGFRADTNQLYIKATTNGGHSIKSNHYRGIAVDIAQINGSNVLALGPNNHLVVALQNAFEKAPNRRENYGPAFERKWGQPWPVGGHENHLHFSVDGN